MLLFPIDIAERFLELLEINTLENAVYMSMKNDLSFLIDGRLSLYEHQSTYNPNLPLRFLIYISQLYAGMTRNENPKLELEAVMLNISGSNNSRLKEAKAMSIFEYDQDKHIRQEREEAWEEGRASGLQEGQASGLKLAEMIFRLFREGKTIEEISAGCDLPAEQIRELLGQQK